MSRVLPTATGPFVPGCSDIMLDYEKNGLFFRLFYPTDASKDAERNSKKRYHWIPTDVNTLLGYSKVLKIPYFILRLVFWWNGNPLVPVLYGEKVKTIENMKCIIFSHGLGGHRDIYSKICYDLASHGFLVACLEHRDKSCAYTYYYESKENALNDKRTPVEFQHVPFGGDHLKIRKEQIKLRSTECLRLIDVFKKLNHGIIPKNILDDIPENKNNEFCLKDLVGTIDIDNFTVMGHSFGAATALATTSKAPSIKQCIALDPWMYPIKDDNLEEKIDKPLLFINTQTFHIKTNVNAMAKFMTKDKLEMYTIRQTTHEHQTDSPLIVGCWLNLFMKKLDPIEAININNALIIKFLNEYIGLPKNIENYEEILKRSSRHFEEGLTKAWC